MLTPRQEPPKKDRNGRVPATATTTIKGEPRTAPPRRCGKCGELGRRSDTCGVTHNIGGEGTKPMTAIAAPVSKKYTPAEIDAAKARSKERIARIASRAEGTKPAARRERDDLELHEYDPENLRPGLADPDAVYELPVPRSSFVL